MNFYKINVTLFVLIAALVFSPSNAICLPKPIAIDNRIRTFIHSPYQVYPIEVGHGLQSYIEFGKGEKISVVAMGDYVSWRVKNTPRRIFLRPMQQDGKTNMLVITNKSSYTFDLIARPPDAENVIYIARFYHPESTDELGSLGYPSDDPLGGSAPNSPISAPNSPGEDNTSASYRHTNYDYGIEGDAGIRPSEVFNTEKVTFIKLASADGNIPRIYRVNDDGSENALEMFSYKDYTVVDGLHKKLSVRYKDQRIELINHEL